MNQFARPGLAVTELPPVNADDNGKVLGVSDGAWAKVAASGGSDLPDDPAQDGTYNLQNTVSSGTGTLSWVSGGSGGGVLVVRIARNGDYLVCDKTASEIWTATQSGIVLLMFGDSTNGAIYPLKSAEIAAAGYFFHFGDDYIATATNGTDYPKIPF